MSIKRHIPNTITLLNLLCGSVAIIFAFKGWQLFAVYLIFSAAVFDFFDGFTARLLKAYSPIGKELDSLADLVSFGLAPSILIFYRLSSFVQSNPAMPEILATLLPYIPLSITLASALRLAIFNTDTRQTNGFIGLPTPANAILIGSFIHYTVFNPNLDHLFENIYLYPLSALFLSYLLVSDIPMFSLKIKSLGYKANKDIYHFAALSILLVLTVMIFEAKWSLWLVLTFVMYILYNIFIHLKKLVF